VDEAADEDDEGEADEELEEPQPARAAAAASKGMTRSADARRMANLTVGALDYGQARFGWGRVNRL
jgi:hypothetical protein